MTTILRIDASARTTRSLTRRLGDAFLEAWWDRQPDTAIIRRDVGTAPPAFVSEAWIAAAFTDRNKRTDEQRSLLATSDHLIDEVRRAEIVLITTPMYNNGMPAALKAWFDQVIRINETFTFDLDRGDRPLEPIFSGKILVLLTSWGEFGFGPGEPNEDANHLVPHVRTAARYLGTEAWHHLGIEYQEFGDDRHQASKTAAFNALPDLVDALTTSGWSTLPS